MNVPGSLKSHSLISCWALLLLLPPLSATAATITNTDRNLNIRVDDAREYDGGTRLLYHTMPDITQAHVSEKCATNFYIVDLKPGLTNVQPQALAENYCAHIGFSGTITDSGDVVIVANDRVETWRPGTGNIGIWELSAGEWEAGYGRTVNSDNIIYDVSHSGELLVWRMLPRKRNDTTSPSGTVVRFAANGEPLWKKELHTPGVLLSVTRLWASADGGALLLVAASPLKGGQLADVEPPAGSVVGQQDRLYRLDATGAIVGQIALTTYKMPDPSKPMEMPDLSTIGSNPDAFKAILERQQSMSQIENVDQIAARTSADGRVHVLFRRGSSNKAREGTAHLASQSDGTFSEEFSLQAALDDQALRTWVDFDYKDGNVLLYGVVGTRANRLPQGYISHIDSRTGNVQTQLVPLNPMGLQEARNARDEQVQNLEHNPGQDAVMLGSLNGNPLLISLTRMAKRPSLQVDEGTAALPAYDPSQ